MAISRVKFYGKTIKGSRYIIRKNRGPKNKKLTRGRKLTKNIKITKEDSINDVYPNKLYEQCPKSNDCTNNVCQKTTVLNSVQNPKNLPMMYIQKISYMNIVPNPWGFRVMTFMVVPSNVPDISKSQ